jgi:hypothetical protein
MNILILTTEHTEITEEKIQWFGNEKRLSSVSSVSLWQ